jgi:hypothetical protein
VVMLRGGLRSQSVRAAVVAQTGDESVARELIVRSVGLRDYEVDSSPNCHVIITKDEQHVELEVPTVNEVLGYVTAKDPFEVRYLPYHGLYQADK